MRAAKSVYHRTARRGFLAKSAAAVMALGLGEAVFSQPASANCSPQCCGPDCACRGCPGTCPGTKACQAGWYYSGYTWSCCLAGGRVVFCRDCCRNGTNCAVHTSNRCICTCVTQNLCSSPGARQLAANAWSGGER
jgi:hypothetical protein